MQTVNRTKEALDWFDEMRKNRPAGKVHIFYSPEAWVKASCLVQEHNLEVGWDLVIEPYKDGYLVEDVLVYPQRVSGASITVDVPKYGLWKASLADEQDANLRGQAHSHVNMATEPSSTDILQQYETFLSVKEGFLYFEIWNKRGDISSFFYDKRNNQLFDSENVEISIECSDGPLEDFSRNSFEKLRE